MKFIENLLIKQFVYKYRFFKEQNPNSSEEKLCDLVLVDRIKKYPSIFSLTNNSDQNIRLIIDESFKKKEKNLPNICEWLITEQYEKKYCLILNSSDLTGWLERIKELKERIKRIMNKIPRL